MTTDLWRWFLTGLPALGAAIIGLVCALLLAGSWAEPAAGPWYKRGGVIVLRVLSLVMGVIFFGWLVEEFAR